MELLGAGMEPLPAQNSTLLQNALSRVIVEMIKREWPQQWPTLLQELHGACNRGCPQTEIVLLIFLRLVEDVAQLQVFFQLELKTPSNNSRMIKNKKSVRLS